MNLQYSKQVSQNEGQTMCKCSDREMAGEGYEEQISYNQGWNWEKKGV